MAELRSRLANWSARELDRGLGELARDGAVVSWRVVWYGCAYEQLVSEFSCIVSDKPVISCIVYSGTREPLTSKHESVDYDSPHMNEPLAQHHRFRGSQKKEIKFALATRGAGRPPSPRASNPR